MRVTAQEEINMQRHSSALRGATKWLYAAILLLAATAFAPTTASAADLVCFHQHTNYGGNRICATSTGTFNSMPAGWNDYASSVTVASGYKVELFQHTNLGGSTLTVTANEPSLVNRGFNDMTSSYRVSTAGSGFSSIISESQFNQIFPNRNPFYTYQGLLNAQSFYTGFGGTGDTAMRRREVAAAMANFHHETGGLVHITEIAQGPYCSGSATPCGVCAAGKSYYGRGPIQLSWNFNYCAAGQALGLNLWADPDMVARDPAVAWKTALWFWMTQTGSWSSTAHNCIVNNVGFGCTIRSINGSVECPSMNPNGGVPAAIANRIAQYDRIRGILGNPSKIGADGC
jgi:predicted chitinase